MDHIPSISQAKPLLDEIHLLRAPGTEYDGRGVDSFVDRFFSTLLDHPEDTSATAQAWLFFGLLNEICNIHAIPFLEEDFVAYFNTGAERVTTRHLKWYLAAWTVKATTLCRVVLVQSKRTWWNPVNWLEWTRDGYQGTEGQSFDTAMATLDLLENVSKVLVRLDRLDIAIKDEIWDSILLLCATILSTSYTLYRPLCAEAFDTKYYAVQNTLFWDLRVRKTSTLFDRNGWCPCERRIIKDIVDGDPCLVLYCAQLSRHYEGKLHANCDISMCNEYQVDETTYQTRHVDPGCNCEFLGIDTNDQSKLMQALEKNKIIPQKVNRAPMVVYQDGRLKLTKVSMAGVEMSRLAGKVSDVLDFSTASRCVAISHVWGDGLGNAQANTLPECQLARIQVLVNKLFPSSYWPVPFWIDTLCIPVMQDESRRSAIANMEWVYKSATAILVFDNALLKTSSKDMSAEEIGMRILCSGWSRRLWTAQEAAHLSRARFQFADGTHIYDDLNHDVKFRSTIFNIGADVPANHPLKEMLTLEAVDNLPYALSTRSYKVMNIVWPRIARFFKQTSIYHNMHQSVLVESYSRMLTVMRALRSRTTSRLSDEALVITSLLHVTTGSAKDLDRVDVGERMRYLFQKQWEVPASIIFMDMRRYKEEGSRWIPQSVLGQTAPDSKVIPLTTDYGVPSKNGLRLAVSMVRVEVPPGLANVPPHIHTKHWTGTIYEAGTRKVPENIETHDLVMVLPSVRYSEGQTSRFVAVLAEIFPDDAINPWPVEAKNLNVRDDKVVTRLRHLALIHGEAFAEPSTESVLIQTRPLVEGTDADAKYHVRIV